MDKRGPIIIIEENIEDRRLFAEIFLEISLNNEVLYFDTLQEAEEEVIISDLKPFIFFINILQFEGDEKHQNLELHKAISQKSDCPYFFYSLLFPNCFIIDTYCVPTQSYFINPYSEEKLKQVIGYIIKFWNINYVQKTKENKERKIKSKFLKNKPI